MLLSYPLKESSQKVSLSLGVLDRKTHLYKQFAMGKLICYDWARKVTLLKASSFVTFASSLLAALCFTFPSSAHALPGPVILAEQRIVGSAIPGSSTQPIKLDKTLPYGPINPQKHFFHTVDKMARRDITRDRKVLAAFLRIDDSKSRVGTLDKRSGLATDVSSQHDSSCEWASISDRRCVEESRGNVEKEITEAMKRVLANTETMEWDGYSKWKSSYV
jgi:hypothetical protein